MAGNLWDRRFLASTTGRILSRLRRRRETVDELAEALRLSDNAVRSQLHALERDGLVDSESSRRGPGKPAWLYRLTPEAERVFPKSYATILDHLLAVLDERLPAAELDAALVAVGERMAATVPPQSGPVEARLPAVTAALAGLGGLAEVETQNGCLAIQGFDCPLARTARVRPDACRVLQAMLETVLEQSMTEACDRGDPPRCRFLIGPVPADAVAMP